MRRVDPPKLAERPAFAAEAGASADSAKEMKDTPGVSLGKLHSRPAFADPSITVYKTPT
ncbi:MAG: hypothetical protein QF619_00450 [Candidatus Binatia bacterium]|jgi:hypothetical protein|nr:hypothetical protein [Candidatus Binatia bacterium]